MWRTPLVEWTWERGGGILLGWDTVHVDPVVAVTILVAGLGCLMLKMLQMIPELWFECYGDNCLKVRSLYNWYNTIPWVLFLTCLLASSPFLNLPPSCVTSMYKIDMGDKRIIHKHTSVDTDLLRVVRLYKVWKKIYLSKPFIKWFCSLYNKRKIQIKNISPMLFLYKLLIIHLLIDWEGNLFIFLDYVQVRYLPPVSFVMLILGSP